VLLPVFSILFLLLRNVSSLNGNQHGGSQRVAIRTGRTARHDSITRL